MKNIFVLLLILELFQFQSIGCTIIVSDDGSDVYVGNNEDFLNDKRSKIWFVPASKDKFGAAFWGFNYFPFKAEWIPQGGINEHGLFFDKTSVPEKELVYVEGKKNAGPFFLNSILQHCKTVDEAIHIIKKNNLKHFSKGQILIADRTGNYAVVENNTITRKRKDYAVVTNFRISEPGLGGYPSKKYSSAMSMFENNHEASVRNFKHILNEVHQVNSKYSTIYSQICDLKNGVINLFYFHNFEHSFSINLKEELNKGKHSYFIADLFPARVFPEIYDIYLSLGLDSALVNMDRFHSGRYNFCESELYFFANILFEHFLYENTIQVCDKILTFFPQSDETMLLKAKCLVHKHIIDESIELVKKSVDINPYNFTAKRIVRQLCDPQTKGNTKFELKGYPNAKFVTIVMSTENWEDLYHIMYRDGDSWKYSVDLPNGSYEYIYKVDGQFVLDSSVKNTKEYPTTTVMILNKE